MPTKNYIKMSRLALKLKALGKEGKNRTALLNSLIQNFDEQEVDNQLIAQGLKPKDYELKGDFY